MATTTPLNCIEDEEPKTVVNAITWMGIHLDMPTATTRRTAIDNKEKRRYNTAYCSTNLLLFYFFYLLAPNFNYIIMIFIFYRL